MDPKRETTDVLEEFKRYYENCLGELNKCKDEQFKERTKGLRCLLEHLWEQNQVLFSTVEEMEEESIRQVRSMQRRLEQQAALGKVDADKVNADVEALTKIIEDMANGKEINPDDVNITKEPKRVQDALKRYMDRLNNKGKLSDFTGREGGQNVSHAEDLKLIEMATNEISAQRQALETEKEPKLRINVNITSHPKPNDAYETTPYPSSARSFPNETFRSEASNRSDDPYYSQDKARCCPRCNKVMS